MHNFIDMKVLIAVFVLGTICGGEAYSTENDNFDIDKGVSDPVTLKAFVGCFLDKANCNEVSAAFKKDMPDAIETSCIKCNDRQKYMFKVFLESLQKNLPVEYEEYQKKYDPQHKHFDAFLASVA